MGGERNKREEITESNYLWLRHLYLGIVPTSENLDDSLQNFTFR